MSNLRAMRYRQLALASTDAEAAQLLRLLADEADRGVLVTADWCVAGPQAPSETKPMVYEGVEQKIYVPFNRT